MPKSKKYRKKPRGYKRKLANAPHLYNRNEPPYLGYAYTRYENSQIEGYPTFSPLYLTEPPRIAGMLPSAHPRPWVFWVLRFEPCFRPSWSRFWRVTLFQRVFERKKTGIIFRDSLPSVPGLEVPGTKFSVLNLVPS